MKHKLSIVILSGFLLAIAGYFVLIYPDNPFTHLFRSKISDIDAKIIIGPYPVTRDFALLKKNQVMTIISLLNPQLPYEKTLLESEKTLAAKYGIEVLNFPMTSILGQRFGESYEQNAQAAVAAIAQTPGKVYLHCYLGLHRVKFVAELAQAKNVTTALYAAHQGERSEQAKLLDRAEAEYSTGQYSKALATLQQIEPKIPAARLLQAWATYRVGDTSAAHQLFADILQTNAGLKDVRTDLDAHTGLGYCALRENDARSAQEHFSLALKLKENDPSVLLGLGLAHYRQGALPEAARYLEMVLQIDPQNEEAKELFAKIGPAHRALPVAKH